jgi:hypothetical protein
MGGQRKEHFCSMIETLLYLVKLSSTDLANPVSALSKVGDEASPAQTKVFIQFVVQTIDQKLKL